MISWIAQDQRAIKQRPYSLRGFGGFASAAHLCAACDALRQDVPVRPRSGLPIPLAPQRRLFVARWRSLILATPAASDTISPGRITTLRLSRCPQI